VGVEEEEEEELLTVSADDCKYRVATAAPGHKLKVPVPATTSPMFGTVGQQKDCSRQCLEVSAAVVV
jgi:hypothetical protein